VSKTRLTRRPKKKTPRQRSRPSENRNKNPKLKHAKTSIGGRKKLGGEDSSTSAPKTKRGRRKNLPADDQTPGRPSMAFHRRQKSPVRCAVSTAELGRKPGGQWTFVTGSELEPPRRLKKRPKSQREAVWGTKLHFRSQKKRNKAANKKRAQHQGPTMPGHSVMKRVGNKAPGRLSTAGIRRGRAYGRPKKKWHGAPRSKAQKSKTPDAISRTGSQQPTAPTRKTNRSATEKPVAGP